MANETIRTANVAVLLKLEAAEGIDANPNPATDAIAVEANSVSSGQPWTFEQSNEATGSLVAGAQEIIGQPTPVSFKTRVRGVGGGAAYTAAVKPPAHAVLQCCGWRGQFHPAVAAALATGGSATSITLPASFPGSARALLGAILRIGAGKGAGYAPAVIEYTAGRIATLAEPLPEAADATTSVSLAAAWSYAQTSPLDGASRLADQPSATVYIYRDGKLKRFTGVRGTLMLDGRSARAGYATFQGTGIYAGEVDTPMPTTLAAAAHSAPVLLQATAKSPAVSLNGKPLNISTWSLEPGSQLTTPDDPNTLAGFASPTITDRMPMLKVDPLATLVANRDLIAEIGQGMRMPGVLRFGSQTGNRWSLVAPLAQQLTVEDGERDKLMSEQISAQCLSLGRDAYTRDTDRVLFFD